MNTYISEIQTPLGFIIATATNEYLISLEFKDYIKNQNFEFKNNYILELTKQELDLYFAKKLKIFSVNYKFDGTEFYNKTWQFLNTIEYGNTISYSDEANILNTHPRAVARANAANKLPIIIPCHRVIAKSGKLSGYAYGAYRKEFLLKLEGAI